MLYVFNVDTGAMFTFDMSLAVESVNQLMQHIEKSYKIPTNRQVLLVSGGEALDPNARVCSYSAGTDTNPIYLYNLALIEAPSAPSPSIEQGLDIDFTEKVRELNDMPATYNTVCQRTLLAQQFYDAAKDVTRICENIVHEQHLQQQGWAAVIANFEDTVASFTNQTEVFEKHFQEFMNDRELYLDFLKHFYDDLDVLSKIPILPALSQAQKKETEKKKEKTEQSHTTSEETADTLDLETNPTNFSTLLEWVTSVDNRSKMDQLFQHCSDSLERFNTQIYSSLQTVIQNIFTDVKMEDYIDIKGLSDRLCGLEKLMFEAKKHVQEQGDLAQSFAQNQTRAGNIGDTSILPDLCASHRKQLKVMLENHNHLIDNRRRCVKAKAELGEALHRRLQWIAKMDDLIHELNNKMMAFRENLQRLRQYLVIIQQIHLAPTTYMSAVAEVVRRRAFSQAFLSWASEIACHLLTIHNDEVTRRKDFQAQFESHFLNLLFPGMEDMPPPFATEAPSIFDSNLPKLTIEDIEQLKRELPDLAGNVSVPDISAINNLFLVKSLVKEDLGKIDDRGVEEKIVQVVNEVGLASNLDRNLLKPAESETCLTAHGIPLLKDLDKGCESETDTEEFEKVGQSPLELHFEKDISSPRPRTHDASTLTEVGDRNPLPPRKPPRAFQKPQISSQNTENNTSHIILPNVNTNTSLQSQRTMSFSGSQSNTESFTNVKNPSLESIDELSSIKNFNSNTESCFNSHHQQMQSFASAHFSRSKSLSPHTPQSPKDLQAEQLSPSSPIQGHQPNEFVTDEFYIDESLPSSLSIETGQSQGEFVQQLDTANNVVALLQFNSCQFKKMYSEENPDIPQNILEQAAQASADLLPAKFRLRYEHEYQLFMEWRDLIKVKTDNLQNSRSEHDRLKSLLVKMAVLVRQAIGQLRLELNELKSCVVSERNNMELQYESLTSSWENLAVEMDNKEKEIVHRITVDHELEINDFKKLTESKQKEVKLLQDEVIHLESSLRNSSEEISSLKIVLDSLRDERKKDKQDFEKDLNELKVDKDQSVKEVSEKLILEHKAEIESIRSRFRLMAIAKMERSPSDTNLDGIERGENKELTNHEAIILQLKENCEIEKEKAINAAVLQESRKWESILNEKLEEMKTKYELEKEIVLDEATKRISEEKDKQIDLLREREANLNLECIKYKNTIQQLAESETESQNVELLERVEALEKEKNDLEMQLSAEKSKRIDESMQDMAASVAVCEGKVNAATSPIKHTEKLTKSQTSLVKSGRLNIDSCHSGDAVLVLWDSTYKNYRIIQEGNHLYFLHSDCLDTLNLNVKANEERKPYFTGEVVEKDYCHAKKVGNRYNVPRGTKFFRVKVKPLSNFKELKEPRDRDKSSYMSQSESAGPSTSENPATDSTASISLPVTPSKQSPVEADTTQRSEMEVSTESNR